jgi:hypothetical protein
MRRRRAIAVIITTLVGAGGLYSWRRFKQEEMSPEERMQQNFKNSNIYESDGWYLSEYEVQSLQLLDANPVTTP